MKALSVFCAAVLTVALIPSASFQQLARTFALPDVQQDVEAQADTGEKKVVRVEGTRSVSETWTNDKIYRVVGSLVLEPATTLTIEPGTQIQFCTRDDGQAGTPPCIQVGGKLICKGTLGNPIEISLSESARAKGRGVSIYTKQEPEKLVPSAEFAYTTIEAPGYSGPNAQDATNFKATSLDHCVLNGETLAGAERADLSVLSGFADADAISGWARGSVAWAKVKGVINGYDEDGARYLRPYEEIPRERVATILMNAFKSEVLQ